MNRLVQHRISRIFAVAAALAMLINGLGLATGCCKCAKEVASAAVDSMMNVDSKTRSCCGSTDRCCCCQESESDDVALSDDLSASPESCSCGSECHCVDLTIPASIPPAVPSESSGDTKVTWSLAFCCARSGFETVRGDRWIPVSSPVWGSSAAHRCAILCRFLC